MSFVAAIRGQTLFVVGWGPPCHQPTIGGGVMKKLTSAQLFAAPKIAHKTKARLERAKLVIVAARARAAEITQQSAAQPLTMRPTVLQRRRLAQRWRAKRAL
jgi:hypothetical protein